MSYGGEFLKEKRVERLIRDASREPIGVFSTPQEAASRQPAVAEWVDAVTERIQHVTVLLLTLQQRLAPVLQPEPPAPAVPEKEQEAGLRLVPWLKQQNEKLLVCEQTLNSILKRLEV